MCYIIKNPHLGVESLRISLLHHRKRHVHKHLQELQALVCVSGKSGFIWGSSLFEVEYADTPFPNGISVSEVWRYEGHDGDGARVGEQAGQLAHSAHTLSSVRLGEAQVSVQTRADIVSIQSIHALSVLKNKLFLKKRSYQD